MIDFARDFSGIDAKYCPPSGEGICDECLNYSPYCLRTYFGVVRRSVCRKCRLGS